MTAALETLGVTAAHVAAARRPLEQASLLPGRIYTDPAIYELERERIFARSWLPVCHVSQLEERGAYVARRLAGESLVAVRGRDDAIRVLSNVCRHRYTALTKGAGTCKGNRITCPYHGWTFGLDGKLLAAPFMDKVDGFDKAANGLRVFRHEVWHGFVFVNMDDAAPPLAQSIAEFEPQAAPYRFEEMKAVELYRQTVPWNWKISLENFSEAYHQPWVHPQTAEHFFPANKADYQRTNGAYSLFRLYPDVPGEIQSLVPNPAHLGKLERESVLVYNIYPYFHSLVDPGVTITLDIDFLGPQEHEQIWTMLLPRESAQDIEAKRDEFFKFIGPIVTEDIEICRAVGQGAVSRHTTPGRLSTMERAVHDFQNWWLDRMTTV
jgi:choline monooxygenase